MNSCVLNILNVSKLFTFAAYKYNLHRNWLSVLLKMQALKASPVCTVTERDVLFKKIVGNYVLNIKNNMITGTNFNIILNM